jgi:hypothetical protein
MARAYLVQTADIALFTKKTKYYEIFNNPINVNVGSGTVCSAYLVNIATYFATTACLQMR